MREIRLYGSEGGGAAALPTPILKIPSGASEDSPGRHQRQEPLMPPWVSVPTIFPLSPGTFFVLGERARARVRGKSRLICENHTSCREMFEEQRNARLATR